MNVFQARSKHWVIKSILDDLKVEHVWCKNPRKKENIFKKIDFIIQIKQNQRLQTISTIPTNNLVTRKMLCDEEYFNDFRKSNVVVTNFVVQKIFQHIDESLEGCLHCIQKFHCAKEKQLSLANDKFFNKLDRIRFKKRIFKDDNSNYLMEVLNYNWNPIKSVSNLQLWTKIYENLFENSLFPQKFTFSMLITTLFASEDFLNEFYSHINYLYNNKMLYLVTGIREWEFILHIYEKYLYGQEKDTIKEYRVILLISIYVNLETTFHNKDIIPFLLQNFCYCNTDLIKWMIFEIIILIFKNSLPTKDVKFVFVNILQICGNVFDKNIKRKKEVIFLEYEKCKFETFITAFDYFLFFNLEKDYFKVLNYVALNVDINILYTKLYESQRFITDLECFIMNSNFFEGYAIWLLTSPAPIECDRIDFFMKKIVKLIKNFIASDLMSSLLKLLKKLMTIFMGVRNSTNKNISPNMSRLLPIASVFFYDRSNYFSKKNKVVYEFYHKVKSTYYGLMKNVECQVDSLKIYHYYLCLLLGKEPRLYGPINEREVLSLIYSFSNNDKYDVPGFNEFCNLSIQTSDNFYLFYEFLETMKCQKLIPIAIKTIYFIIQKKFPFFIDSQKKKFRIKMCKTLKKHQNNVKSKKLLEIFQKVDKEMELNMT